MEKFYTLEQVAEILQVHPKTVCLWLASKKLETMKIKRY